jgi:hypothetical protein
MTTYPDNADGRTLRGVEESGSDMASPMVIDFAVSAPNEAAARLAADIVEEHDFDPSLYQDEDTGAWSIFCSRSMLATYEGVTAAQATLMELLEAHGCRCDGWSSFGNG